MRQSSTGNITRKNLFSLSVRQINEEKVSNFSNLDIESGKTDRLA